MWNMDEKGYILGMSNRAKVITCAGRRPPRSTSTQDGTWELETVVECCGTGTLMFPPMVISPGISHY
jgi:hypothetical protein